MKWVRALGLVGAATLVTVWAVLHGLGWADNTVILTGSFVPGDPYWAATKALIYAASWLAMVVFAPIVAGGSAMWIAVDSLGQPTAADR